MYDILLLFLAFIGLPKVLFSYKKYKKNILQRLGIGFPLIDKGNRPLIWIHAVSVGEAKAASSIINLLKERHDQPIILVTCVTETGVVEAKKCMPQADYITFLPFDFSWVINPIVKRVRPDLVIFCETDFWYNFIKASKKQGARIAVINGKISENSLKKFRLFKFLSQRLFSKIDLFCLQSEHYKERFSSLGIPDHKITITGNLKLDVSINPFSKEEMADWRKDLGFKPEDKVLVFGSTHDQEELLFIESIKKIRLIFPDIKALIVPRHPERFDTVAELLKRQEVPFKRYSEMPGNAPVYLVDRMGVLQKCYQAADIAIVAGSFTSKVGGHNILEPCYYGVPVVFGPFMYKQPEFLELIQKYQAGVQTTPEELTQLLIDLLKGADKRSSLGKAGIQLITDLKGASSKTFSFIKILL